MIKPNRTRRTAGAVSFVLVGSMLVVLVLAGVTWFLYCPCERVPGGWLLGDENVDPVSDWSFVNDAGLCQVQVSAVLPHSINLNCMSTDEKLYLSCARCEGKYWSRAAIKNADARIRIGERVYPVKISRVVDPQVLDKAWLARVTKLGRSLDSTRPEDWWSFRLDSRRP